MRLRVFHIIYKQLFFLDNFYSANILNPMIFLNRCYTVLYYIQSSSARAEDAEGSIAPAGRGAPPQRAGQGHNADAQGTLLQA